MRAVISDVILFLVPFALFWIYVRIVKRNAAEGDLPDTPWVWLTIAGLFAAGIATLSLGFTPSHRPGQHYEPAHVENGRLVPAQTH